MEIAVQVFGAKLGVKFTDSKDWANIVEQTAAALKPITANSNRRPLL